MKKDRSNHLKKIALVFVIWRELLFVPLYFAKYIPFRTGYDFTTLWGYVDSYWPVAHRLLYPWANFDGIHYLTIAGEGYSTNARFMPLFPLFISAVNVVMGNHSTYGTIAFFAGLLLSNTFLFVSLLLLWKLISLDYHSDVSFRSIMFLLLFPTSFFLGSIYSESLFLLLCISAFYAARREKWLLAGLLGALASSTRIVGIVLFPALLIEFFMKKKKKISGAIGIALIPLGVILYSIYNWVRWGNPLYFLTAHTELANGRSATSIIFPPQTMYRYFKMLTGIPTSMYEWWVVVLEFTAFCFTCYVLYLMWKQKIRWSYVVFAFFGFLIPVLSGTLTGLPRYILPLFPLFISLGIIKHKLFFWIYTLVGIIIGFALLMLFARGYYIA